MSQRESIIRKRLLDDTSIESIEDGQAHIICPKVVSEALAQRLRSDKVQFYSNPSIFGEGSEDEIVVVASMADADRYLEETVASMPLPQRSQA